MGGNDATTTTTTTTKDGKVDDPRSVVCLVLREGPTPRTAILASQHYGWTTYAIDPSLSDQWIGRQEDVTGYFGFAGTLGDFVKEDGGDGAGVRSSTRFGLPRSGVPVRHLVVIGMQPSVRSEPVRMAGSGHIHEVRSRYDDVPTTLVSLCPVRGTDLAPPGAERRYHANRLQGDVGYAPNFWYVDDGVFSECREVKVWNFHNTDDDDDSDDNDDDDDGDDDYGNFDATDVEEGVVEGRGPGERNDNLEGEERGLRRGTKKRGNIVPKKKKEKKESLRPASSGEKEDRPRKLKNEIKKNEWLEERVAQFQKQREEKTKNVEDEHPTKYEADNIDELDDVSFDDTLSTKETSSGWTHSHDIVDRPGGVGLARKSSIEEDRIASPIEGEGNSESLSPLEVDQVLNIIAKHQVQEWRLCNQSEEHASLDGSQRNSVEHDGDNKLGESPQDDVLPDGWEAILDPDSGDYYYTNWDTSEVTWDRPGTSPRSLHDEESFNDATDRNDATDAQLLMGVRRSHGVISVCESDDSAHVLIDDSSVNSGIAALNRWNEQINSQAKVAMSNGSLKDDRDMINWSDEEDGDEFDSNPKTMQRSRSNPWHKTNDNNESLSSFVYE